MYANQNENSRNSSQRVWWVGGLLMVAAALAVWLAFRATPARTAAPAPAPLGAGQSVPSANVHSFQAYVDAHNSISEAPANVVPNATAESVAAFLSAHGEPPAAIVLSLPNIADQGPLAAVIARDSDHPFTGPIVPDDATESLADYLIAHGEPPAAIVLSLAASQGSLDAVLARDSDHPITP